MPASKVAHEIEEGIAAFRSVLDREAARIEQVASALCDCLKNGRKVLFFGNGGSAADSQHLAAEFVGRYLKNRRALPAIALTTDTSILTAVGNDFGFDRVFERQVEALGVAGDFAFGISTSGNSANVLMGLKKARSLGLKTVALTGRGGGKMKDAADFLIAVDSDRTPRIQECHALIGHILCEIIDEKIS